MAAGADSLVRLQTGLKCGTGCGACLPELNRMLETATIRPPGPRGPDRPASRPVAAHGAP
ncbi:MAG: hypothetical protein NT159_14795 [Proteobacteria bacterium]|nr:hypothetical protein [Pseudomonadota bacterium]